VRATTVVSLALLVLASGPARAEGTLGYYRQPTLHRDVLVFVAEGDLWRVGAGGGLAQRLTTHPGEESRPALSPDGSTLAFSASYEGPTEIYTMPLDGGLPTRLTWEGGSALVVGWTPTGRILYTTRKRATLPDTQLAELDPKTSASTRLPLAQAADGAYDAPGGTLFFTRLPFQGSHTKRYKGGTAQNLWRLAPGDPEARPLTADYPGTSKTPLFWKGRLYFASDRDGTMNLWSMLPDGKDLRQHTRHRGSEVQSPSLSVGRIVYQLGADIRIYSIAEDRDQAVGIRLASDLDQTRERWIKNPMEWASAVHLSPKGDRVALTARGQVFVAPVVQGRLVEATRKSGVRYRDGRFFPDGKSLLALSDETGEVELARLPANGVGVPETLTNDGKVLRWEALPSPDGKWIVHHDKDQQLWLLRVDNKQQKRIATSEYGGFGDLAWSPDSRWLAYSTVAGSNGFQQLFLYGVETGSVTALTTNRYDSESPTWSPDGKWLYLLSDRNLRSLVGAPWGPRQPEPFFDRQTNLYLIALRKDLRSPFQPADELQPPKPEADKKADGEKKAEGGKAEAKDATKEGAAKPEPVRVEIDLDGITSRLLEVPVPAGNYGALTTDGKRLYFVSRDTAVDAKRALRSIEIDNKPGLQAETFMEDIRFYELSADGKKLLVRKADELYVFDAGAKAPAETAKSLVSLKGWTFAFAPREEWRQMFAEAWRLERDYFYDRDMHGVDWPAMRRRYEPLVDRVTDRSELSDLLAQMVSELSALHIFVRGGDIRKGADQVDPATLGAVLARDEAAGGWRVDHVYRSDPDRPDRLSPLARPGTLVRDGEVIESINGVPTLSVSDPAILLRNQADRQVLLRVQAKGAPARDVVVTPISPQREADLRYDEWEYTRRLEVERLGKGRVGYVHLRAMGGDNIAEWAREFYPVFDREGLVIDVRHNRGGNIDSWILEKLLRKAWFYWQGRMGRPTWNMQYAFRGHVVVLVNEYTASDGEAFAEGFRRLGLGKLIGTRTWGGEIWLSSSNFLVDRGIATAAETGVYGPEGEWLIEGHGVDPDIEVDNLPRATFGGKDAQLEAAVDHVLEQIRLKPVPVPPSPRHPDKSLPQ
jgi:tricorn protease